MAQGRGSLPPMWETRIEFLAWALMVAVSGIWGVEKQINALSLFLSLFFSLSQTLKKFFKAREESS